MLGHIDCIYWGLFLGDDYLGLQCPKLENVIVHRHVTFGFKVPCPEKLVGTTWTVKFTGRYGNDGKNEAYEVEIPEELVPYYENNAVPHLTVSVSEDGRPVDSANLEFEPIYEPFELEMTIGYFPGGSDGPLFTVPRKCFVVQRTDWDFCFNRAGSMVDETRVLKVFEKYEDAKRFVEMDAGEDGKWFDCKWSVSEEAGKHFRYSGSYREDDMLYGLCYDILRVHLV